SRVPSMTRKCTRTVSPALKCGTSRSCSRSISWMRFIDMGKSPGWFGLAHGACTPRLGGGTRDGEWYQESAADGELDPLGALRAVRARDCSRRHLWISAWWPELRMSGTPQPRNSAGRV